MYEGDVLAEVCSLSSCHASLLSQVLSLSCLVMDFVMGERGSEREECGEHMTELVLMSWCGRLHVL